VILEEILHSKWQELAQNQEETPLTKMEKLILDKIPPIDLAQALQGEGISLIAEAKKASPSRGLLSPHFNPIELAVAYADNGASAISVLTEVNHFQGNLECLPEIKKALGPKRIPLLRKDFLFHPYQIYQSRAFDADAILLIVAILTDTELGDLLSLSHQLGMHCLVEVHDRAELEIAIQSGAKIIGINNRDLHTFTVDINTTERLCQLVPPDRIIVSESGIRDRSDIDKLREWGVDAVLVGEALVTATDVATKMKEFI
jgi:indole-3-glycerol phosphate synthase